MIWLERESWPGFFFKKKGVEREYEFVERLLLLVLLLLLLLFFPLAFVNLQKERVIC